MHSGGHEYLGVQIWIVLGTEKDFILLDVLGDSFMKEKRNTWRKKEVLINDHFVPRCKYKGGKRDTLLRKQSWHMSKWEQIGREQMLTGNWNMYLVRPVLVKLKSKFRWSW